MMWPKDSSPRCARFISFALLLALPVRAVFTVSSGECITHSGGTCVHSPNYPSNHGNNEECTIDVASPVEILSLIHI